MKEKIDIKEITKKLTKKILTTRVIFIILGITVLFLLIFKEFIFPADSYIVQIFSEDYQNDPISYLVKIAIVTAIVFGFLSLAKIFILLGHDTTDNVKKTWYYLFGNLCRYISVITGLLTILTILGVDTTALLAGAGVLTLIVGLGCQSLVADIVAGIFIMFEGNFQIGDIVVVDGFRGEILSIGIRTTRIKNDYGNIKVINNSNIKDIVNNSKELSIVTCDIGFDYGMDLDVVEKAIKDNLTRIEKDVTTVKGTPQYRGVVKFTASEIVVRVLAYCEEPFIYQTQRDINRQLLIIFRENKIDMAFNQVTLSYRDDNKKQD